MFAINYLKHDKVIKTISIHPSHKNITEIKKSSIPKVFPIFVHLLSGSSRIFKLIYPHSPSEICRWWWLTGSLWNIWNIFIYPLFSLDCSRLGAPFKLWVADGIIQPAGKECEEFQNLSKIFLVGLFPFSRRFPEMGTVWDLKPNPLPLNLVLCSELCVSSLLILIFRLGLGRGTWN